MTTSGTTTCWPARGRLAASAACLLFLASCAPGMENVRVELRAYEASGAPAPRAATPAKLRLEAVKDARGDSVGSHIGERTTIGGVSMGSIELDPLPTDVMAQMLRAELSGMGHGVVAAGERFTVAARLRKFQVLTPATAVYWDINGAIELELTVGEQGGGKLDSRYAAACTDRTYLYPSEELIQKVVSSCVGKIGAELRADAALAKLLGAP